MVRLPDRLRRFIPQSDSGKFPDHIVPYEADIPAPHQLYYSPSAVAIPSIAELDADSVRRWTAEREQYLQEEQRRKAEQEERRKAEIAAHEQERLLRIQEMEQAEQDRQRVIRRQNSSPGRIRHLRWLVQEKYRLDVHVWSKRNVLRANWEWVKKDYLKSDMYLQDIYDIVDKWEEDMFDDKDEWLLAKKIKENIWKRRDGNQHPIWASLPPWEVSERREEE